MDKELYRGSIRSLATIISIKNQNKLYEENTHNLSLLAGGGSGVRSRNGELRKHRWYYAQSAHNPCGWDYQTQRSYLHGRITRWSYCRILSAYRYGRIQSWRGCWVLSRWNTGNSRGSRGRGSLYSSTGLEYRSWCELRGGIRGRSRRHGERIRDFYCILGSHGKSERVAAGNSCGIGGIRGLLSESSYS